MNNVTKINNFNEDTSNSELVQKSQAGDKAAFEMLVHRHQDLVFSLAFKLTGNKELANDVGQEAFIRAWKAIDKFRGDSTFSTWIYRITVNTAWTLRKKAKKHYSLNIEDTQEPIVIDEKNDPELIAINSDLSFGPILPASNPLILLEGIFNLSETLTSLPELRDVID